MNRVTLILAVLFCLSLAGCQQAAKAEKAQPEKKAAAKAASAARKQAPVPAGPVRRVVFVGQKKACDCTHTRIDEGWSVLQAALAKAKPVEVERIQRDVDKAEAARLIKLKPLMVAPGLYLFDAQGRLVELLQGEVDEARLSTLLP